MKTKDCLFVSMIAVFALIFSSCSEVSIDDSASARLFETTGSKNYQSIYHVETSGAINQSKSLAVNWYKNSSFYYIFINDFYDSNNDGYGDFNGIREKLDYIKNSVGCDSILISPIFESYCDDSGKYFTYDVMDFYSVNHLFGTEYDLLNLITEVHKKGMKIAFDFVPNHTSIYHPWFTSSLEKDGVKNDWYLWSEKKLFWDNGMQKGNWYENAGRYYYAAFDKSLPDLNYNNLEVREEIKNIVRYWLNKGFDGLRIDGVRYLVEEKNVYVDSRATHDFVAEINNLLGEYKTSKFLACETRIENDRNTLESYFGTNEKPEFNVVFDHDAGIPCIRSVLANEDLTGNSLTVKAPFVSTAFATCLGNNSDSFNRLAYAFKNDAKKINLATALSLLRPTVSFIYYGNELCLYEDPMTWDGIEKEVKNKKSTLNLNKTVLDLKAKFPVLRNGKVTKLLAENNEKDVLAYVISDNTDVFLCIYNFSDANKDSISFIQNSIFNAGENLVPVISKDNSSRVEISSESLNVYDLHPYSYSLYYSGKSKISHLFDAE